MRSRNLSMFFTKKFPFIGRVSIKSLTTPVIAGQIFTTPDRDNDGWIDYNKKSFAKHLRNLFIISFLSILFFQKKRGSIRLHQPPSGFIRLHQAPSPKILTPSLDMMVVLVKLFDTHSFRTLFGLGWGQNQPFSLYLCT